MTDPNQQYREVWQQIVNENQEFIDARRDSPIINDLAKPECTFGYTDEQVTRIMGARLYAFRRWMRGQTEAICEGEGGCGPHGIVTYRQDVERFLLGLPVVD